MNDRGSRGSRYAEGHLVKHAPPDVEGSYTVRVLNLPWDTLKEEVRRRAFAIFGTVGPP